MKTAKVFKCGNSQAVRLPKDFQLDVDEVWIKKDNGKITLQIIPRKLKSAFHLLSSLPEDFLEKGREDTPPKQREDF